MAGYIIIENIQNKGKKDDSFIYIPVDRTNPILGNNNVLIEKTNQEEREKVIKLFSEQLDIDIENKGVMFNELVNIKQSLEQGKNISLQCWCSPLDCHAEIIADRIQKMMPEIVYRPKIKPKIKF